MKYAIPLFCLLAFLFAGCGEGSVDIHSVSRETKAYETAVVEQMDAGQLIAHLLGLADEMSAAVDQGAYVEMHHLEIALTKALAVLEREAPAAAKSTIGDLKILAVKIHEAGHDQNESMARKLDRTLRERILQLQSQLEE